MKTDENKYFKAKERVAELKKFYNALFTFVVVNLFFVLINYMTNGLEYAWFWWVTVSWGLGMVFYAFKVFGWNLIFSKNWEERKIREIMEKEDDIFQNDSNSKWE